jgi:hypothetical protein
MENEQGFIYKIKNKTTGKVYIGQTREFKKKNGIPYNYGIKGRWCDHISSSKRTSTPLAVDIQKYSAVDFEVEELEKANLDTLDALEAKWIDTLHSAVPNGYNVMRHSQNKHRVKSNISSYFTDKVVSAELRKIRNNGEFKLVYCNLLLENGSKRRIVFGQNKDKLFDEILNDAINFLKELDITYTIDNSSSDDPLERYSEKINEFSNKEITKIRITEANSLIAVYVTTSEMKSWKDQKRICFGGKTISKKEAYDTALLFVEALPTTSETEIFNLLSKSATGGC